MEPTSLFIVAMAFFCEFVDSTLGMGYGTTLTPVLLMMGYSPLQTVPAVLLSELLTGLTAALMHSRAGNVRFDFRNDPEHWVVKRLGKLGYMPKSNDSKVALVLAACSVVGTVIAVYIAVNISKKLLKTWIGLIVLAMGVIILWKRNVKRRFSWGKILGLGTVASFNKGLSGGGYGPLVTSGQILSGLPGKSAVAITSLAEGLTCLVGVLAYYLTNAVTDWGLAPYLIVGAMASVPFSVKAVKVMDERKLTLVIGAATVFLGAFTLYKTYM
jgi:uncharacterized membrane protein YfcA